MTPALLPGLPSVLIRIGESRDHRPNENAMPRPTQFERMEYSAEYLVFFRFKSFDFLAGRFAFRLTGMLDYVSAFSF